MPLLTNRKIKDPSACGACHSRDLWRVLWGLRQKEFVPPRERARPFQIWHFKENSQVGRRTDGVWVADLLALWLPVQLWVCNVNSWTGMQLWVHLHPHLWNKIKITDGSSNHRADAIIRGNDVQEKVSWAPWQYTRRALDWGIGEWQIGEALHTTQEACALSCQ